MLRLALVLVLLMSGTAHALPLNVLCRVPGVHDAEVIRVVHAVGLSTRVSDKVMLAGFEAGWVESHMNNLACGDADSLGVFQQRPSMGWGTPDQIMNVSYAASRFFELAVKLDRAHLSPGLLADAVQRSCCPERYDQAEGRARSMLRQAWQGGPEVVGGMVYVVEDGDVRADGVRLSTSQDYVGRPSVAGTAVYARTAGGEVRTLLNGAWQTVATGVAGDPEAVLRPDGTVELFAVVANGSVARLSAPAWPQSPPGFATGKPSAVVHADGSVGLYVRSGDKLMATAAGAWREIATGLEGSPEAVVRPDGTVGVYALEDGRPHRLGLAWEPLGEGRFIDTVSAQPDGTVHARTAGGEVVTAG
ncbi:hypothetical protein [Lentzea sp. NBRC 102530]|uniref:hypothetical protein n=1 Tax=Lentzea sp. NBRC 102530 TaxID=3032201 RepID=UPI0024A600E0|nr:hypothetical protein [Lentzea sp. NBRC 102530]GLY54774.1 hypothetical protein Lesp01_84290 [Lentzea sp. NBRC 102530]